MKDFEASVAFLGQWGRFQQVVFFLLCASVVPNGFGAFSVVFLTDTPAHRCLVPEVNLTQDWLDVIIPIEVVDGKQQLSRCSRFRLDVVRNLSALGLAPAVEVDLSDLPQETCVDGWSYSRDVYQSTIVSQFDLVCRDQWKQPFTSTLYFLGVLCGSFFSGLLSDRFGRKPVLFATMAIQTVFIFVQIFSNSWTVFVVLLFISGLGQISNYISAFVLGNEILTGRVRVLFSSLGVCLAFAFGFMMLPLFAYFLRDWRSLLLATSLPSLLYIPLWWWIPESPRWLLSRGRVEEAEAAVRKAAEMNKVEAPQVIFEDHSLHADVTHLHPKEQTNVFDLLRTKPIRDTTAIMCLVWFTLSTGYYTLSLNTSHLHADPYVSCFLSAAAEVPAYTLSWLALRFLPRRPSAVGILLVGGASLYSIQLVPESLPALSTALGMLGKCVITAGIGLGFAYTAELYPTALRNTAAGTLTAVSRVGGCVSPFVFQLSVYFKPLPHIVMGTLAVVSAFAAFFLPESFGRPLPQTIHQMPSRESIRCLFATRREPSKPAALSESRL
uniref:Major facilitator superfamily (MFS) profile domain-containing protein n=1 Tax=Gasterosteus aculeatus aculeatus TaxID=481459 RepID=A0AAQ4PWI3_GASAC|nr:solute carrier family 22 member 5-like [Gasterosteus aculeatus aculeatus]